jgi:malonyl CoA-acyl carrier protein transacylase
MVKIAHAYPGQGAQFQDMDKHFSRKVTQIASESCKQLVDLLSKNDERALTETFFVQSAIYLVEASLLEKLPTPSLVLGHSSGEYAALVEAKVWDIRTGFEIVRARGHFSQSLAPKGFMVQVPTNIKNSMLSEFKNVFEAAINSEDRVVLAGVEDDWPKVKEYLESNHIDYRLLPITAPFHTPYMEKAAQRLRSFLELNPGTIPAIPVYLNALDRLAYTYDDIVEGLTLGLTKTLNWVSAQQFLKDYGITTMVEVYPHPYLAKFTKFPSENAVEYYRLIL